jgi:hypothetical protein
MSQSRIFSSRASMNSACDDHLSGFRIVIGQSLVKFERLRWLGKVAVMN